MGVVPLATDGRTVALGDARDKVPVTLAPGVASCVARVDGPRGVGVRVELLTCEPAADIDVAVYESACEREPAPAFETTDHGGASGLLAELLGGRAAGWVVVARAPSRCVAGFRVTPLEPSTGPLTTRAGTAAG